MGLAFGNAKIPFCPIIVQRILGLRRVIIVAIYFWMKDNIVGHAVICRRMTTPMTLRILLLTTVFFPLFAASQSVNVRANWPQFEDKYGSTLVDWNEDLHTPHRAFGFEAEIVIPAENGEVVADACLSFIEENQIIFGIDIEALGLTSVNKVRDIWYVEFHQRCSEKKVWNTEVIFRVGSGGKIMALGFDYFHELQAQQVRGEAAPVEEVGIYPHWIAGELVFDWAEELVTATEDRLSVQYVSRFDSAVLGHFEKHCDATIEGSVKAQILPVLATDPLELAAVPNLLLTLDGVATYSDAEGNYNLAGEEGSSVLHAELKGKYVSVIHFTNEDAALDMVVNDGDVVEVVWDDQNSDLSERNVYFHTDYAHSYIKQVDPDFTALDYPLVCYVEDNLAFCNAYWNGTNIHYNPQGTGCAINSAHSASTIYHEYGHAINDHIYQQAGAPFGLLSSTLHEALADITSCLMLDEPQFALGWFGPGTFTRNLDNVNHFPESLVGQQHTDGLILGGSFWDLRELTSPEIAYELAHFAKYGTPDDADLGTAFAEYYLETLIADDDNGDLADGTPHFDEINMAFCLHGIGVNLYLNDQVVHVPLSNQLNMDEAVSIETSLSVPDVFLTYLGEANVHFTTDNFQNTSTVSMDLVDGVYITLIPSQPSGTVVKYYFSFEEALCNASFVSPSDEFEVTNHSFWVGDYVSYFKHDFETDQGWIEGLAGDNATAGLWERANPDLVVDGAGVVVQPGADHSPVGTDCYVTGAPIGNIWYAQDVDGGQTTITSPVFSAVEGEETIFQFYNWFTHGTAAVAALNGSWTVLITNNGTNWVVVEQTGASTGLAWKHGLYKIENILEPTENMQIRVVVDDPNPGSIVEALFDDFEVLHFGLPSAVADYTNAGISVFPNPTNDDVQVHLNSNFSGRVTIQIFDMAGQLALVKTETGSGGRLSLDVGSLATGKYELSVWTNTLAHRCSLVVE
jgi:hypothetical protein